MGLRRAVLPAHVVERHSGSLDHSHPTTLGLVPVTERPKKRRPSTARALRLGRPGSLVLGMVAATEEVLRLGIKHSG